MASAIHFDPYHKWLGIPPDEQPPNHYRLLGIKPFESDADVIQSAADQRMAHLRTLQTGAHGDLSQKILNELAAARVCLLKPDKKAAYDVELKRKLALRQPASSSSSASLPQGMSAASFKDMPIAPAMQTATPDLKPVGEERTLEFDVDAWPSSRRRRATNANSLPAVVAAGVVAAIALAAGGAWFFLHANKSRVATTTPTNQTGHNDPKPSSPTPPKPITLPDKSPTNMDDPAKPEPTKPEPSKPTSPQPTASPRRMPAVIDDSDVDGFSKSGDGWQLWQNDGVSFKGTHYSHKSGTGEAVAAWKFDGLQTGRSYMVFASWHPHEGHATNARYVITGIEGEPATVDVNQRVAAKRDAYFKEHVFQKLGTFKCAAGEIIVRLSDQADGDVVADVVLLAPGRSTDEAATTPNNPPPVLPRPSQPLIPQMPAEDNRPTIVRAEDPTWLTQFKGPVTGITVVEGEGRALVTNLNAENPASLWDLDEHIERRRIDSNRMPYLSAAAVPGQRLFFLGAENGMISIWDLREDARTTVYTLTPNLGPITALAALGDSATLAVGGRDQVHLIRYTIRTAERLTNHSTITTWQGFTSPVTALAVSPDGRRIVAGCGGTFLDDNPQSGDDMKLHGFDVSTKETKDFPGHQGSVWSMSLSADGSRLATASSDGKVRLWDTVKGRILQEMSGHDGAVLSVAISPDGGTIFSGGEDATVRIWDARMGRQRNVLRGHLTAVRAIAYDSAGRRVLAGAQNGELRMFDVSRPAPSSGRFVENREPPPAKEAQAAARKLVREVFADDIAKAKTPLDKTTLAETWLAQAAKSEDVAERFVLVEEARKLAIGAGDVDRTLSALHDQTERYEIDRWSAYCEAFDELAKSITTNAPRKQLAETVLEQADFAIADDHYVEAKRMLATALAVAKKTSNTILQRQIINRGKEVPELAKAYESIRKATETIKLAPDDAEANLTLGRYFCFTKQDWSQGLPYLTKGSDAKLADLAQRELANPTDADAVVQLADDWANFAADTDGAAKSVIFAHAELWYRDALSKLSGLSKTKVEKRLEELVNHLKSKDDDEPGAGRSEASSSSTATRSLMLQIRSAIKKGNLARTARFGSTTNQNVFQEVPPAGLLLIGFNFSVQDGMRVASLQPIYASSKGNVLGATYGDPSLGVKTSAVAPKGYAVGGIEGHGGAWMYGLQLIYMKIGKSALDPTDTQRSALIGTDRIAGGTVTCGGNGQPVVGIFGSVSNKRLDSLGLIEFPKQ